MLTWIVKWLLRRAYRAVNSGNIEPVLRMMAEDVRFVFPGTSSWAGEYRGKAEVRRFLSRVVDHGLQYEVHDILLKGPPWNMVGVVLVSDRACDADGRVTYENRALEYCRGSWGRLRSLEVFEDTEKSAAWDRLLAQGRA